MSEVITSIDKSTIKDIETALMEVMPSALEEMGLSVEYTKGRYSNSSVELTFIVSVPGIHEEKVNKLGESLGAKFKVGFEYGHGNSKAVVTGFNRRRPMYPVSVTRISDGQKRKTSIMVVNHAFDRINGGK